MLPHRYSVRVVRSDDGWAFEVAGVSDLRGWVNWLDDVEAASKDMIADRLGLSPASFAVNLVVGHRTLTLA